MKKKLGIPGKQRFRALLAAAAGVLVLAVSWPAAPS